jgi:formylglycine-generating enzyme required for sulfatase activity
MANLFDEATCLDRRGVLLPAPAVKLVADDFERGPSQQGSFASRSDCSAPARAPSSALDGTPLFDEEICIPGGAYLFGNRDVFGATFVDSFGALHSADGIPERVAVMPAFRLDRYEVTVGRWRRAIAEGFVSPEGTPLENEMPIAPAAPLSSPLLCSWSALPREREHYPLNCVSWADARAFCQFYGGDLPSEAEWEYAAQAAERPFETRYPWGWDEPDCTHAIFGRLAVGSVLLGSNQCADLGAGPQPVDASAGPGQDVSLGLGVVHLGGGVAEMLRDAYHPLRANCWAGAPLESPVCIDDASLLRSLRGGAWALSSLSLHPGLRLGRMRMVGSDEPVTDAWVGLRCVRPGDG